jgi:hypothetical protein
MGLFEHPDVQKVAEYRRKAIEANFMAVQTEDAVLRGSWQTIALSYQDMADRLERQFKL